MSDKSIAYHEAGHTAADLLLDHGSIGVTIVPGGGNLGSAQQLYGDDMTAEGMEDLVIALYAGAEAEKHVNPDHDVVKLGASSDDEKAANYLRSLKSSERELRERTVRLLTDNWGLVELIASELLLHGTLIGDELDIMLSVYRGELTMEELEGFRMRFLRVT